MTNQKGSIDFDYTNLRESYPKGENYVLAIAIDEYPEQPLYNCVSDAKAIVKVLVEQYQFEEKNVTYLFNANASIESIYCCLEDYAKNLEENDSLLIYFSGHGKLHTELNKGYWIPADCKIEKYRSQGIPNSEILDRIALQKARHVVLLIDSCFAGSLFATKGTDKVEGRPIHQRERFKSRWAITAGRKEVVSDGKPGDKSPFAQKLVTYLKEYGKEQFTISELADFIIETVARNASQQPDARPLQNTGDDGGRFVFYKKPTERPDTIVFHSIQESNDLNLLQLFINDYPDSPHKTEAKRLLKSLRDEKAWQKAAKQNTVDGYDDYLEDYPSGKFAEEARKKQVELADILRKKPLEEVMPKHNATKDFIKNSNVENQIEYTYDIVICIDATGSTQPIINTISKNTHQFYNDLCTNRQKENISIKQVRVKTIVFRDFAADGNKAFFESPFYHLPDDNLKFANLWSSIYADGGGDEPENGLEALDVAIRSDWRHYQTRHRQIIVLFTDASAHPLEKANRNLSNYPSNVATNFEHITNRWENNTFVNDMSKQIVLFAPETYPWSDISNNWSNVIHYTLRMGYGLSEIDYNRIIDSIVQDI